MADKYFPRAGDVIDGARNLLKAILDGKITKYPTITLQIAGIEANASKEGYGVRGRRNPTASPTAIHASSARSVQHVIKYECKPNG